MTDLPPPPSLSAFTGSSHLCQARKATCKLLTPICRVTIRPSPRVQHPALPGLWGRAPGPGAHGSCPRRCPEPCPAQAAAFLQPASSLCWKLPARCAAWLSPTACPPQGRQGCQDGEVLTGENVIISLQHLPGFVYIGPLYVFALFSACLLQSSIVLK